MTTSAATYPDLAGKVAVISGGSAGIGAATARLLSASGAKVAICARREGPVDELVEELRAGGAEAIGCSGDASRSGDMERLQQTVEARLGPADLLFPFAGGFRSYTPIQEITEEEWRKVVDDNLTSTFLMVKPFLAGMIERGHGAIVTMASNSARTLDIPLTASYASSKGGVVVFTRHAAKELGAHGIRVNCIAPATTLSDRVDAVMSDDVRRLAIELAPLGRMGLPEDSANAAVFLASEAASWLTGITLDVAGGRVML